MIYLLALHHQSPHALTAGEVFAVRCDRPASLSMSDAPPIEETELAFLFAAIHAGRIIQEYRRHHATADVRGVLVEVDPTAPSGANIARTWRWRDDHFVNGDA